MRQRFLAPTGGFPARPLLLLACLRAVDRDGSEEVLAANLYLFGGCLLVWAVFQNLPSAGGKSTCSSFSLRSKQLLYRTSTRYQRKTPHVELGWRFRNAARNARLTHHAFRLPIVIARAPSSLVLAHPSSAHSVHGPGLPTERCVRTVRRLSCASTRKRFPRRGSSRNGRGEDHNDSSLYYYVTYRTWYFTYY